jgi:hypothetical protein
MHVDRRAFMSWMAVLSAQASFGCVDESRYGSEDEARLEKQRREEAAAAGRGPFGKQLYRGYRGLGDLPCFDIDEPPGPLSHHGRAMSGQLATWY